MYRKPRRSAIANCTRSRNIILNRAQVPIPYSVYRDSKKHVPRAAFTI